MANVSERRDRSNDEGEQVSLHAEGDEESTPPMTKTQLKGFMGEFMTSFMRKFHVHYREVK